MHVDLRWAGDRVGGARGGPRHRPRAVSVATHYHELTTLASRLDSLTLVTVKVREWNGELVFLHEVAPGAADRSYGLAVAKLAGLPAPVIARAKAVLTKLEAGKARTEASPPT